jgi:hypothetical protein
MPCLLLIGILAFPRIVLVLMWLFTNVLTRAYQGMLIPILGFIFLPVTTIVYAWLVSNHMPLDGINVLFLVLAVLVDAGSHGGGARYYRR